MRSSILNIMLQNQVRQKPQGQLSLSRRNIVQVNGIDNLGRWDMNIDDSEIFGESMSDKDTAQVD